MARNFRRHRGIHPISELNVTNLIDLGFILLVIFMISTPLIQQEQTIPLKLPVESKSPQAKVDKDTKFHSVSILAGGQYFLDNDGVPLSLSVLKSRLSVYAQQKDKPVIRLRMDANSTAQQIVTVMDELKKLDLTNVTFDTQTSP